MKPMKIITTIAVFIILAGCAGPQKTANINDSDIPLGTTTIVAFTDLQPTQAYKKTAQILQNEGYVLDNTDASLKTITTKPKHIHGHRGRMSLSVHVLEDGPETKVIFNGKVGIFEDQPSLKIEKTGQNRSLGREAWKEMYLVAKKLDGELAYK
ncbi:MAG: hypothetical protein KGY70_16295 [Bacteroidales bacterium]|nr:hypothetical protein [Bacteroidales bacterium]